MRRLKTVSKYVFGLLFVLAGLNHFLNAAFYVSIMPPYLPWHEELVAASGVCEIVLGTLILVPRAAPLAGWGLVALLVAVFPANVHMATHADRYPEVAPALLWARLPLQGVLVAWAYWCTRPRNSNWPAGRRPLS